jgi:hypothetical protein
MRLFFQMSLILRGPAFAGPRRMLKPDADSREIAHGPVTKMNAA